MKPTIQFMLASGPVWFAIGTTLGYYSREITEKARKVRAYKKLSRH